MGLDRHAGTVTSGTTGLTNVETRFHDISAITNLWVDFVIGVK